MPSIRIFIIFVVNIILLLGPNNIYAQTDEQREWLLRFAQEQDKKWHIERAIAESIATKLGMPIRKEFPDGKVIELQRFENGMPVYYCTGNLNAARTISTDDVWSGGSGGFSLTGSSETLGIWDGGGVRLTHQEFGGRATQVDVPGSIIDHATHVAGTMIASGVDPNAKGMSYQARLRAYDWNNVTSEMASEAVAGLKVSNHSWGWVRGWEWNYFGDNKWAWFGNPSISPTEDYKFGFYSFEAMDWDNIVRNSPNFLIVIIAHNNRNDGPTTQPVEHWVYVGGTWILQTVTRDLDGGSDGYDCIPNGMNVAKNVLTVGAVYDIPGGYQQPSNVVMTTFSGWGPTDDGRIKPDVVANGTDLYSPIATSNTSYDWYNGTSMAAPNVSGSVGLLLQYRKNLFGSNPLRSATLKTLIINTADEAGPNSGPDYMFGWGLMNTLKVAQVMRADSTAGGNFMIREFTLNQGAQIEFQVLNDGTQPLRATICWTDPAGTPPSPSLNPTTPMLVNDLDLRVISPSPTTYYPWTLNPSNPSAPATTGDNTRDNVEQVHIASPSPGIHTVRINHKGTLSGGSQQVSVIVTGIVKDAGVIAIENPASTIDSSGPITPRARIKNFGVGTENVSVTFKIGAIYTNTRSKTLSAGQEDTVNFVFWTPVPGNYVMRCSTYLANDGVKGNDTLSQSLTVGVKDIAVLAIEYPAGTIDSTGTPIIPRARIRNYSAFTQIVQTTFKIDPVYNNSRSKILNAGQEDTVNFQAWTPIRGSYTTRCSTYLVGDVNPTNDTLSGSFTVQVKDVGVTQIITPSGIIDSTGPITPIVQVKNHGTNIGTFFVTFRIIGTSYNQTRSKTLGAGAEDTVNFSVWTPVRGNYTTRCSTFLVGDANRTNDTLSGSVTVQVQDIGITQINFPSGTIDTINPVTPQAQVKNYGTNTRSFFITLKIGTVYTQTRTKTLDAEIEDTVNFPTWTPIRGIYTTRCSTYMVGDANHNNDTLSGSVTVQVKDVGVTQIVTPTGTIDSTGSVIPQGIVNNYGTNTETFDVTFRIGAGYVQTRSKTLDPGVEDTVNFLAWVPVRGTYTTRCSTYLAEDINQFNDTLSDSVTVQVNEAGWQLMAGIPNTPSTKNPKSGSCMAGLNGKIYFLKASNTQDFHIYTPNTGVGSWTNESIPLGTKETGDGKKPKKGASMTDCGTSLFALRGNNTPGFWTYKTTPTESIGWHKLANITTGLKNPKDASGLVAVNTGGTDYIFAMKGSKTDEFYLYDILTNTWTPTPTKPTTGSSGKLGYKKGSCLCYDGANLVYVMKGTYGDFFSYNLTTNTWTELKRYDSKLFINRDGKKKKIGEGSGLVYYNNNIYLLKGGNTYEFWMYDIASDSFMQMGPAANWDIPTGGGKKVKGGGTLALLGNDFYAAKGANSSEFYRHGPPTTKIALTPNPTADNEGTMANGKILDVGCQMLDLSIIPNPVKNATMIRYNLTLPEPVSMKLYNITGTLVKSYNNSTSTKDGIITIDVKTLSSGVYILRFSSKDIKVTRKFVVEK